jgi:hypothetical protein
MLDLLYDGETPPGVVYLEGLLPFAPHILYPTLSHLNTHHQAYAHLISFSNL